MADREVLFWGRINAALWAPDRMLMRVENGVMDGVPDAYVCLAGSANWIELKAPIAPARSTTQLFSGNHKLSLAQRNWLLLNRQAGGRGWVAIETERSVFLVGARHADLVNKMTLSSLAEISDWTAPRPTSEYDWDRFISVLINKDNP